MDPVLKVWESPYLTFGGNPILMIDPNGNDWYENNKTHKAKHFNGHKKHKGYTRRGDDNYNFQGSTEKEVIVVGKSRKSKTYITEFILKVITDNEAPRAIAKVAEQYYPDVKNFSGDPFDFKFSSKKAIGVMLYGFASGRGDRDYHFDTETIPGYDFFYGGDGGRDISEEILKSLYTKINSLNLGLKDLKKGWKTSIGIAFSPDHTGSILESFSKHINSNSIQFFVGGATAKISILGNQISVQVYNEASRSSFFAHGKFGLEWAAQNVKRESQNSGGEKLSTITMTFDAILNLDPSRVRKK